VTDHTTMSKVSRVKGDLDRCSASMDAGRETADRFRELWRRPGGFGDGTASWAVGQPAVHLCVGLPGGRLGDEVAALMPVEIAAPSADSPTTIEERGHAAMAAFPRASKCAGLIVIEVGNGRRIRVDRDLDAEALGRVIDILDRRR
jgi:hypothetical protein